MLKLCVFFKLGLLLIFVFYVQLFCLMTVIFINQDRKNVVLFFNKFMAKFAHFCPNQAFHYTIAGRLEIINKVECLLYFWDRLFLSVL